MFYSKKIEKAKKLLTITDHRIGDIAFECGFKDQAHFTRLFRAVTGVSPSQFRMNHNGKFLS